LTFSPRWEPAGVEVGVEPYRTGILGATGVSGPSMETALQDLVDRWAASDDRPEGEIDFLRTFNAPRIAVALWLAPSFLDSWVTELDLQDPLWAALRSDGQDQEVLLRAAMEAEEWEVRDPNRSYLLGAVAQEVGDDALAARLFSRLDSLVYRVESRDTGWGLLALSYFHRGKAYDAMDEEERATRFYRRFTEAWVEPDMPTSLIQEARQRLNELSR